jgi:hypothetical protein
LGFPSGPTSPACATTIGADCACDGVVAKCIAVRAVVASSARRSFVMMVGSPEKCLAITPDDQQRQINKADEQGSAINE